MGLTYDKLLELVEILEKDALKRCPPWVSHLYDLGWVDYSFVLSKEELNHES